MEVQGEGEVRAAESDAEADAGAVAAAVALLRLVEVLCFFWPADPVAPVLALALTLGAALALALAILAVVAVTAVREASDGGGGDPIVAVVEKVLLSEVVVVEADVDPSPPARVLIMSFWAGAGAGAVAVAMWSAERASENADCGVATVPSAFSGVGHPPMCAIAPDLRRGGGARPSHPCRPLFPLGLARTPSYEAVPGVSWGGRPSIWRQCGAARPKRGTEECIVSTLTSSVGSRGKSCIVSGTPSLRALVPASLMSAALSTARSAGVAWSMGMKRGIFRGSAGTGSRRLVPMLGCCQEQKPSAPVILKLWCSSVSGASSRMTAKCILDGLLQVSDVLEPGRLIVIDIMVVFEQSKVRQKYLLLGR